MSRYSVVVHKLPHRVSRCTRNISEDMPIKLFGGAAEGRGAAELEATRPTLIEVVTTEPGQKKREGT